MKTKLFNRITNSILALSLLLLTITSCSSDNPEPDIVFTNLTVSKTRGYIEDFIILDIEGTGYTNVSVSTIDPSTTVTKKSTTSYEISASKTTYANIKVDLTNGSKKESKNQTLNFYEHGVLNFDTVEGLKVDGSTTSFATTLLGEPDYKTEIGSGYESWKYLSKGISLSVNTTTSLIYNIDIYGSNYYYTNTDNIKTYYTTYPYEIGNGWKINNSATTMDMVVAKLGTPTLITSSISGSSLNVSYKYTLSKNLTFHFYSDSESNYTGKKIISFSIN